MVVGKLIGAGEMTVHTVYLDFASYEAGALDGDTLLAVSSVFAERYPELGAACGGGVRARRLGRAGFDVCLSTEGFGGMAALRRALEVADEALLEAGFGVDPDDMAIPGPESGGGRIADGAAIRPMRLRWASVSEDSETAETSETSEESEESEEGEAPAGRPQDGE